MNVLNVRDENGVFIPIEVLKGVDGKTPVKGVDYFTDSDKAEFLMYIYIHAIYSGAIEPPTVPDSVPGRVM